MRQKYIGFLFIFLLTSCTQGLSLFNSYEIRHDGIMGFGSYLSCKLGNSCSPLVEHIYSIEYNRQFFIIEQYLPLEERWFIIQPLNDRTELSCNWCDEVTGPLTSLQKDSILMHEKVGDLKKKTFTYRGLTREKYYQHICNYYKGKEFINPPGNKTRPFKDAK